MKEEIVNAQAKLIDTFAASSSEPSKTNRKGLSKKLSIPHNYHLEPAKNRTPSSKAN